MVTIGRTLVVIESAISILPTDDQSYKQRAPMTNSGNYVTRGIIVRGGGVAGNPGFGGQLQYILFPHFRKKRGILRFCKSPEIPYFPSNSEEFR